MSFVVAVEVVVGGRDGVCSSFVVGGCGFHSAAVWSIVAALSVVAVDFLYHRLHNADAGGVELAGAV